MPESCTCFLANREPLMGFSEVLLWQVRPGDCSILSAPCLPSRADPTVSAVLSPSAVSSFTLFQVPGPHPAAPVLQPRMLPSWGSRASHLETSLWWALWSRCWYGRWASLTMSLSTSVVSFVEPSPLSWAWFTFTARGGAEAFDDATAQSAGSCRFMPLPLKVALGLPKPGL